MSDEATGNLSELLNETGPQPDLNPEEPDGAAETPDEGAEAAEPDEGAQSEEKAADDAVKGEKQDQGEPPSSEGEKQQSETPPADVSFKIAQDERRKRQELERRLAEIEAAQKQNTDPAPDMFEDPEGYAAWQDRNVSSKLGLMKIEMSEAIVRENVGDEAFEESMEYFKDEVSRNPGIVQQLNQSPNPAKFAYNLGLQAKERAEIGDPKQYAANAVAKARQEWEQSLPDIVAKQVQEQLSKIVPKSLADSASAAARSTQTPVDVEAEPIEALLRK
jgi:hypothetical protein